MAAINQVGNALTGTTGTGAFVGANTPTLITPLLGTPTSGVLSGCTGYAQSSLTGLGTGVSTALGSNVTGSGGIALSTSPTFVTPTLGAATATSLTFSSTSGIIGTTTNNNAAAGSVGEEIESFVESGSAVALTTATVTNVTNIVLTAGDWDVWGNVAFTGGNTTLVVDLAGIFSTTSASLGPASTIASVSYGAAGLAAFAASAVGFCVPGQRITVANATTTTVYLVVYSDFSISTNNAYGRIYARRRR